MKIVKIAGIALIAYVGVVVAFESLLGYFQPRSASTLVITTFDEDGTAHDRVVSSLESGDALYVAANHWPRAWYGRALESPEVRVTRDGETAPYRAVPLEAPERERVARENALPLAFKVLTGFPPRRFLRLEPLEGSG